MSLQSQKKYYSNFEIDGIGSLGLIYFRANDVFVLDRVFLPFFSVAQQLKEIYQTFDQIKVQQLPLRLFFLKDLFCRFFQGEDVEFFDIKINLDSFTDFEKKVIATQRTLKRGETISYCELAKRAGFKDSARAVGRIQSKNPFPLIVPCHRVILSSGELGQFQYGEEVKRKLLLLEGVRLSEDFKTSRVQLA